MKIRPAEACCAVEVVLLHDGIPSLSATYDTSKGWEKDWERTRFTVKLPLRVFAENGALANAA